MNQTAMDVLLARFSQLIRGCCVWLSLLLCVAALFGAGSAWAADPLGPGWFNARGTPVTPAEARVLRESAARPRAAFRAMAAGAYQTDAATITPEITALARGLLNDPLLMYEYVHNNVNYVPYYGSLKGATLTYLDGAGNDFDQASLLIALLRAAGFTADYVYGTMSIPAYGAAGNKDMAHWLGVDPNITVISTVLTNAGIPYAEGATYLVDRVWVQVTVSGSTYLLDPAFKVYETTQGIDLVTAMGYNRANVLSAAGGTTGTSSIVNLNEANLRTLLNTYTTNLLANLRANHPNARTEDITGGKTIVPVFSSSLPTSLDFAASSEYTWTSIPQDYAHTVQIKHGQIDQTFNIASLSGQKLAIVYAAGTAQSMAAASGPLRTTQPQVASAGPLISTLPGHPVTVPPLDGSRGGTLRLMGTSSQDFGKIYPAAAGYSSSTVTWGPIQAVGATLEVIASLTSNPQGAYSITQGGGTTWISPGQSVSITVQFSNSGQTAGTKTGQLRIQVLYNGTTLLDDYINLTGVVANMYDLTGSYGRNFGSTDLGYPVDSTVRLNNNGSLPLTITGISLTGTDTSRFSITGGNQTGTLSSGQHQDINVRYLANAVGSHSANVQVVFTYDGLSYTVNLPLSGQTIAAPVAQLWLDDQMLVEETEPITGVDLQKLTVSITHPYPTTFADQSVDYTLSRDPSHAYAIVYDFGASRLGRLVEKRERQLQAYRDSGLADTSRQVLTESLNVIGMTWMRDTNLNEDLLGRLSGVVDLRQHRFGIVAQEEGYYIDVKVQMCSVSSMYAASDNSDAYFKARGHLDSAMEHGVLEQMQINRPAVSTVKLFEINNTDGNQFFIADSSNFSTIRPELVAANYSTSDLDAFQASINSGNTLVVPANGQITVQSWSGRGYIEYRHSMGTSYVGMIIGRGYHGGYGVINSPLSISDVNYQVGLNILPQITTYKIPALEPVDMATGYFLYDNTDLSLSGGSPGLALKRAYNSGNNNTQSAVGNGWSHNYNVYVEVASSTPFGMGTRQPRDAAPMMVAAIATLDIMAGTADIKSWVTGTLIAKWSMDNLTNNGANVHLGGDLLTFIKMPDGSFVSPPGVTSVLVSNGGLYQINERFGHTTSFNSDSKASSITDADGNQVNFTYSSGKLQGVADSFGHSLTFTYTGDLLTQVSDSAARNIYYGYDANNLTSYTDAEGKVWHYGYDANHRILTLTNPLNITTATNVYDSFGRVMTQTVPRQTGTAVHNLYFSGYRNAEDDAAGNLTVYYFDDHKNLIGQENPLGHVTEKVYDGQKHVVSVIDPRNNTTSFQYDGNNNLVLTTDAYGKQTHNTYDASFHLTDVTDPLGHVTHQDFNSTHHPTNTITYPAQGRSITTTKGYYANGLLHTATDGRSITTTLAYDARGNPATSMTSTYPAISYTYDGVGRMTALTDRLSATTNFVYDRRSLLTSRTDPLTRPTAMTYYDDGTLHTVTDRNNATVTYSYTPTSKPNTVTYPGGSTVGFTYNTQDNLVQMQDSLGTTTYGYDAASRLITHTDANGFALTYGYDAANNLTSITYPGNKTVTYAYDNVNRLHTVTDWLGRVATYGYDDAGRLVSLTQLNGSVTTYAYDNADRLTGIEARASSGGALIASYSHTLDDNGNRTAIDQTVPFSLGQTAATSTSFSYNAARNRLTQAGTNSFTYDNEGQLATGYSGSYTFDYAHRLTGIGSTYQFFYDGNNNRLRAIRSGTTTKYIYDAAGNLIAEADADNSILRYYIYGKGLLAMETPGGETYCYHFDATGHTIALTDMSMNMPNAYAYDPYGNITKEQEGIVQPFKYAGQFGVMAEPNGFYYMKARYYDPKVGRFVSEDPIGFEGGDTNLYAYVGGNPVMGVDASGEVRIGPVDVQLSATFLFANISWDLNKTISYNVNAGLSVGAGVDITINPPSSSQNYIQPYLGLGKNLSIGTNLVSTSSTDPLAFKTQGVNISLGASIGIPVGVIIPNALVPQSSSAQQPFQSALQSPVPRK